MYQTKYTVDILIVENTAKFRLHFLISPQIMKVNVDFSIQIQLQIYHGFVVTYSKTTAEFQP